jgi:uncharacterized protein YhfF
MGHGKTAVTEQYWSDYIAAADIKGHDYSVVTFGDSESLANALVALVLSGRKRATASLHREYSKEAGPLPKVGVFCNSSGCESRAPIYLVNNRGNH